MSQLSARRLVRDHDGHLGAASVGGVFELHPSGAADVGVVLGLPGDAPVRHVLHDMGSPFHRLARGRFHDPARSIVTEHLDALDVLHVVRQVVEVAPVGIHLVARASDDDAGGNGGGRVPAVLLGKLLFESGGGQRPLYRALGCHPAREQHAAHDGLEQSGHAALAKPACKQYDSAGNRGHALESLYVDRPWRMCIRRQVWLSLQPWRLVRDRALIGHGHPLFETLLLMLPLSCRYLASRAATNHNQRQEQTLKNEAWRRDPSFYDRLYPLATRY